MLLSTGMRRGELLALTWEDIDFKEETIFVKYDLIYTKEKGLVRQEAKTEKSKRLIPMPKILTGALKRHRENMLQEGHYGAQVPVFVLKTALTSFPAILTANMSSYAKKQE